MTWLLNLLYVLLVCAASPCLVYRAVFKGKYRAGWSEKLLGRLPLQHSECDCIWLHAVSVGEVLQLETVVEQLRSRRRDLDIMVTTTTVTGMAVAREKFPEHTVCYFPLDFSWSVGRALRRVRPSAVVLVELELWPNFILTASRLGIPLGLINGRISAGSFRGYRRIRPLMRRLLSCFDLLAVQNEEYADRLRQLGAPAKRVTVTGSIKFDRIEADRNNPNTAELRSSFCIGEDERVFIAGSTQAPEEEVALETYLALRDDFPDLRLILVPRHRERFDQVAELVQARGLPLIRRSRVIADPDQSLRNDRVPPILLLDTLGELFACWGLGDVAFVGGSLTNRGGQNMIEPAAYGAAVLFGPNTHNFRDVVESLLNRKAARVVATAAELTSTVRDMLADPQRARSQGRAAQEFVLSQRGATARTVDAILQLPPTSRDLAPHTELPAA